MKYNFLLTLLSFIAFISTAKSSTVSGTISDKEGNPLPFATVFVKNTTTGISANEKGHYFLELKPGNYTLIYSFMGFSEQEKLIEILKRFGTSKAEKTADKLQQYAAQVLHTPVEYIDTLQLSILNETSSNVSIVLYTYYMN